jgi:hypothetical protein
VPWKLNWIPHSHQLVGRRNNSTLIARPFLWVNYKDSKRFFKGHFQTFFLQRAHEEVVAIFLTICPWSCASWLKCGWSLLISSSLHTASWSFHFLISSLYYPWLKFLCSLISWGDDPFILHPPYMRCCIGLFSTDGKVGHPSILFLTFAHPNSLIIDLVFPLNLLVVFQILLWSLNNSTSQCTTHHLSMTHIYSSSDFFEDLNIFIIWKLKSPKRHLNCKFGFL